MSISETAQIPTELGQRIPLSSNQQFLCMFDKGENEGSLGPRHLVVIGWRLSGAVDVDALQGALDDVVVRHESLRTSMVRDEGNEQQKIHPPTSPDLLVVDLPTDDPRPRELRAEEFINEIEAGRQNIGELPLLRAGLARFDDQDSVLVLSTHHVASDGWSMNLLIRDLAAFYAARRGFPMPELPEIRQYRDYAEWQQANAADPILSMSREYWQNKLRDARLLPLPTDRPVSPDVGVYSIHRFSIDRELTSATLALSKKARCSPFMVLFSVFNVLLHKRTGVTDILVPTITSGRVEPQFQDTVGVFFNFIPVRTDLAGAGSFREVVDLVRASCLEAYSYEIPFLQIVSQAPDITGSLATGDRALFAFQAFQFPARLDGDVVGDLKYTEVSNRLLSDTDTCDIPDGALWTLDIQPSGETIGSLRFNSNLFDESTIVGIVEEFDRLLRKAVAAPYSPLEQI